MFVYVQLLNGFSKPLLYQVPARLISEVTIGTFLQVPLRTMVITAIVIRTVKTLPKPPAYEIKEIIAIDRLPKDTNYHTFIQKIADYSCSSPMHFYQRIHHFLSQKPDAENIEAPLSITHPEASSTILTEEQKAVTNHVSPFITNPSYNVTVLHGVTGSGKTEVYKALIKQCFAQHKTIILLLPEVVLGMQFQQLLSKQLPEIPIIGFHSASTTREKKEVWSNLLAEKPLVIIGVHQPVLLPIANLGLIIIDEEHETGFQEKKHPKINSKDMAILRAHTSQIPILLGSATPSITTLANVTRKGWHLFELKKRFAGSFPTIQKVIIGGKKMRKNQPSFWISPELQKKIQACLDNKKQAMIYLNRRGFSFFLLCKVCGHTFTCPHCSVSLTPHENKQKHLKTILRCHYCDYSIICPDACPSCKASAQDFLNKGIGTQQLVQILEKIFPKAKIARADLDTTKKKNSWQETVAQFEQGTIDILVGTKTITKGYHFPNVTLVGIIWADLNVHMPVYNAAEMALQQLIQVAGRAGREHHESTVIVQIIQDHPIFNFLDEISYITFAQQEMAIRKEFGYPPFSRIITLEIRHEKSEFTENDAAALALFLRQQVQQQGIPDTIILGPAVPMVSKIKNVEIRHLLIKTMHFGLAQTMINDFITSHSIKSSLFIIPNT